MGNEVHMMKDAIGTAVVEGAVVVHFHVTNHAMTSNLAIVAGFHDTGTAKLKVPEWVPPYDKERGYLWGEPKVLSWRKSLCKVPKYLVVVSLTEEDVIERSKLGLRESRGVLI